ncbi:MAG: hypothetical protein ACOYN3_09865, partial [Acidimicrobiia bacterium]
MFGHGRRIHEARIDAARFDAGLADEVLALASAQRLLASQLRTSGVLPITVAPIDDPAFQALAHEHAERMWELLDDLEMWPGTRIVGPEGATAAWQLVMAGDLDLQRRALDHLEQFVVRQWLEHVDRGPRQQRRIHLERRVLGGRADEGDQPRL